MDSNTIIGLIFLVAPFILGALLFFSNKKKKQLKKEVEEASQKLEKYKDIIDVDEYKEKLTTQNKTLEDSIKDLQHKKDILSSDVLILDETTMLQTYGLYDPIFNFDDSEEYKDKLAEIRFEQKDMVKDKVAATCSTEWTVDGSKVEGRKQTNNNIKLVLRAFNGECDVAVSKVKYNNIMAMKTKIDKAFEAINKAVASNHINIDSRYLKLKIDELNLTHELKEKQFEEKEEQKRIKEEMREEEKAQRELEKAQEKAEEEENKYQDALEEARLEVEQTTGAKHDKMMEKIKKLEAQLLEAQENKQRAISRAQMTRSGHVYVISNIGSFGEDVYKIGMTRRLEPLDRVKELGDASVPFLFDVHAMIFSDDAPKLEKELHKKFTNNRVNMVNQRREFFNVSIDEIKTIVEEHHGKIELTKLAEAKEYRETLIIKENLKG